MPLKMLEHPSSRSKCPMPSKVPEAKEGSATRRMRVA